MKSQVKVKTKQNPLHFIKSCSHPGRDRKLGLGFKNNSYLRVLRFSEKKFRMKKNKRSPKERTTVKTSLRTKTDFLLLRERKKKKKKKKKKGRRKGRRRQIRTIITFHMFLGTFKKISKFSLQTGQTPRVLCYFSSQRIQAMKAHD